MEAILEVIKALALMSGIACFIGLLRFLAQTFLGIKLNKKGSFSQLFDDVNSLKTDTGFGFFTNLVGLFFIVPSLIMLRLFYFFIYNIVFFAITILLIYLFR